MFNWKRIILHRTVILLGPGVFVRPTLPLLMIFPRVCSSVPRTEPNTHVSSNKLLFHLLYLLPASQPSSINCVSALTSTHVIFSAVFIALLIRQLINIKHLTIQKHSLTNEVHFLYLFQSYKINLHFYSNYNSHYSEKEVNLSEYRMIIQM